MLLVIPSICQLFFPSDDPVFSILATFASYTVTLIMRPLGSVIFGIYGDKFGRKKSMLIFVFASILVSIPLASIILNNAYGLMLYVVCCMLYVVVYAFVISTASGPISACFSERFPTQIRNSAAGFSYNAGLIFGSWSPLIALYFMSSVSKELIPVALGINIMIGAIILIIPTLLSRETKH